MLLKQIDKSGKRRLRELFTRSKRFRTWTSTDAWNEQLWTPSLTSTASMSVRQEPRESVTIRVPATSANLGPGFDSIGVALDVWNELTVEKADEFSMVVEGEGCEEIPRDETNFICKGMKTAYMHAGLEVPPLKYTCVNRIPFARGMGSSSAGIVSGLLAGCIISGHRFKCWGHEEFLQFASNLEGHPDNVAPAIYGGIQIGCRSSERWYSSRVRCPDGLQFILFIPDFIMETKRARGVLPKTYTKEECIYNISRAALLVNGLNHNDWLDIGIGTEDALHQPYREPYFKHMLPVINAAKRTGAIGAYLSGAGPTILALTGGGSGDIFSQATHETNEVNIADAMTMAGHKAGVSGRVFITQPTHIGAHVVRADPPMSEQGVQRLRGGHMLEI